MLPSFGSGFVDACPDMAAALADGYFVSVNRAFVDALGWDTQFMCEWPIQWFIHKQEQEKVGDLLSQHFSSGKSVFFESRMKIKALGYVWTDWRVWRGSDGMSYALIIDVTDRHLNEEFLELSNNDLQRFRMAVEYASDSITITDPKGTVIYANNAYEVITGNTIQDIIGTHVWQVWGTKMPTSFYEQMWKQLTDEKLPFIGELVGVRKDGIEYIADLHVSPILNSKRELVYIVSIERDITSQKQIDRMKTDFISLASHQLRTPLTAMRWLAELLVEDASLSEKQHDMANRISQANIRMINLVNTLLNISRIQSGRITITAQDTDIRSLIDEVVGDVTPKYGEGHSVVVSVHDEASHFFVDPGLMRHILMNLLTNALKYSPPSTEVAIRAFKKEGMVFFEVEDHGYGIPQSQQSKVFERFFRGSNVSGIITDGTGLGLYLIRLIVQACGGEVSFMSVEGRGTTFTVTFPEGGMISKKGEIALQSE